LSAEHADLPAKLGKYEIREVLGRGAMSVVYRAYDPGIDRFVALKTLERRGLDADHGEDAVTRFLMEARAAGRLMHPNVVGVFELDQDGEVAFIAMELVEGIDLKTHIRERKGRLPLEQVRSILEQLLAALEYSHSQGVVHRDIKPANVFMMHDGSVKLGDFGIAKFAAGACSMTRAGTLLGTPNYMSPEHLGGAELDGRSDLFSVGVMLYELLTGTRPFTGDNIPTILNQILHHHPPPPTKLNPTLPVGLDPLASKALAKDPETRFQAAAELADALREAFATGSRLRPSDPRGALVQPGGPSPEDRSAPTRPSGEPGADETGTLGGTRSGNRKAAVLSVSPWGNADFQTIAEAVRHAQPFDRVLVEPGTYDESLFVDKPLIIMGKGEASKVVVSSSTSHCLKIAADGVRVRKLSLRGKAERTDRPAVAIGRGNPLFEECDISSRSRLCVAVRGRNTAPRFRNCRIHDSGGVGIHFFMNSAGKLENCSLYGHAKAAIRVDKGANPDIVGGSVREEIVGSRSPATRGRKPPDLGFGVLRRLFSDAAYDGLQGGIRGGLLGLAAELLWSASGMRWGMPLVGVAVGMLLGFAKARAQGALLGCAVALVLMPLSLPESVSALLLDQFRGMGPPLIELVVRALDQLLQGGIVGAFTLALSGASLRFQERAQEYRSAGGTGTGRY
jgi:serine/threonine protein kinase